MHPKGISCGAHSHAEHGDESHIKELKYEKN